MKIYLATNNPNKVKEFSSFVQSAGLEGVTILSASEVGGMPEVEETEKTFMGNAELKVKALLDKVPDGAYVMADDSGIEVDVLDGRPGVRSARYAGEEASDRENNELLLRNMLNLPPDLRGAQFVCCIALQKKGEEKCRFFQKTCEGSIAYEMEGDNGFGYDSLFVPKDYHHTFGVLEPKIKSKISHRAKALREMVKWLKSLAVMNSERID